MPVLDNTKASASDTDGQPGAANNYGSVTSNSDF